VVLEDLGKREDGFDGETGVAEQGDVEGRAGDEGKEDVDREERGGHVAEELVVGTRIGPFPEVVWSTTG